MANKSSKIKALFFIIVFFTLLYSNAHPHTFSLVLLIKVNQDCPEAIGMQADKTSLFLHILSML